MESRGVLLIRNRMRRKDEDGGGGVDLYKIKQVCVCNIGIVGLVTKRFVCQILSGRTVSRACPVTCYICPVSVCVAVTGM